MPHEYKLLKDRKVRVYCLLIVEILAVTNSCLNGKHYTISILYPYFLYDRQISDR